jgi:general secretion pathway protein H
VKTPIFATNPKVARIRVTNAGAFGRQHRRLSGFTLLELLVVMAIGSLLVALMPTAMGKLRDTSQYRDTVRAIVVDLKLAKHQALSYGRVVVFQIDLANRKFGVVGQSFTPIPDSLEVKATVGTDSIADQTQQANISFMPEGGSSGGTVELVRHSGAGMRIRVDWLFGQITQDPRTP